MTVYKPDRWVLLHVTGDHPDLPIYKVLGGWSGGYLDGDSWRINSGVVSVDQEEYGDVLLFHGQSGSTYRCHRRSYGLSVIMAGGLNRFSELARRYGWDVRLVEEDEVDVSLSVIDKVKEEK
jgi:hypothetical protein